MSENTDNKLIVFFDSVGRTILGERVDAESNDKTLAIKNPAVVHIMPNPQSGQLQIQILPLFFKEFLADKNDYTLWRYQKHQITESNDITFDFKLQAQYQQLFSNIILPNAGNTPAGDSSNSKNDVIKLFDE
jgi:hypothetical protein